MSNFLTKSENIKYQLETLSSFEPEDLDHPQFDVGYEDEDGAEGFASVCCIELAKEALLLIKELENTNKE